VPHPREWGIVSKNSSFDAINALQISFNYLCPFKNYLGVPALSCILKR